MSQHQDPVLPTAPAEADPDAGAGGGPEPRPSRGRRRLVAASIVIFALVVAVDQVSKAWASDSLAGGRVIQIVPGVMRLRLVHNPGAAFSFATNATWVFTLIAAVVVVAVAVSLRRLGSAWWAVALGLLAGGAAGNLVDRLLRPPAFARGHVVDFLEWPHFPVFNVADSCVVTAAIMIGIVGLRGVGIDGRRHG